MSRLINLIKSVVYYLGLLSIFTMNLQIKNQLIKMGLRLKYQLLIFIATKLEIYFFLKKKLEQLVILKNKYLSQKIKYLVN